MQEPQNKQCKEPIKEQQQAIQSSHQTTLVGELFYLLRKVVVLAVVILLCGSFVFGVAGNTDLGMMPAVKSGDLILYFRLDRQYGASDLVALTIDGRFQTRRVVAVGGDTVDLTADGLLINGMLQQEAEILGETLAFTEGITFPLVLTGEQVFLLGDNRSDAADSRLYGPVEVKDTQGKVALLLRRRNM